MQFYKSFMIIVGAAMIVVFYGAILVHITSSKKYVPQVSGNAALLTESAGTAQNKTDIARNWRICQGGDCTESDGPWLHLTIYPDGTYFMRGGDRLADQGGKWTETRVAKVINGKWITADIIEFKVKMGQSNDPLNWSLKIKEDGTLVSVAPVSDDEMISAIPLTGDEIAWERE